MRANGETYEEGGRTAEGEGGSGRVTEPLGGWRGTPGSLVLTPVRAPSRASFRVGRQEGRGAGRRAGTRAGGRSGRRDRWLVSYADLMTVLFALFVVLFARAHQRTGFAATAGQAGEDRAAVRARLVEELRGTLREETRRRTVSLGETPEGIVVSLKEIGSFESGGAVPLPAAAGVVRRIAGTVARAGTPVRVEGHTDDQAVRAVEGRPGWNSNWELSTARAEAVLGLLLAEPGVAPGRMSVAGYGAYRPVADNATAEGRRTNRRVDLVLICPLP